MVYMGWYWINDQCSSIGRKYIHQALTILKDPYLGNFFMNYKNKGKYSLQMKAFRIEQELAEIPCEGLLQVFAVEKEVNGILGVGGIDNESPSSSFTSFDYIWNNPRKTIMRVFTIFKRKKLLPITS